MINPAKADRGKEEKTQNAKVKMKGQNTKVFYGNFAI